MAQIKLINPNIDSLKKEYTYRVLKEYCDTENTEFIRINKTPRNYYRPLDKFKLFPICKIYPKYFHSVDPKYILPNYPMFGYAYGSPDKTAIISNIHWNDTVIACRAVADSLLKEIYTFLSQDSVYHNIVMQIKQNYGTNNTELYTELRNTELRIRHTTTQYHTVDVNQWKDPDKRKSFMHNPQRPYNQHLNLEGQQGFGIPNFATDSRQPLGYVTEWRQLTYYDRYLMALQRANFASLRVILDDHIRRGVPIDISWIPEQTLAEIEATKPVRQLKKQIKALEKQQEQ